MLALRNATHADEAFLRRLSDERRLAEWGMQADAAGALAGLLAQQFAAQQAAYRRAHAAAPDQIVEVEGMPVGRCWIDRSRSPWWVVDLALLPAWRGQGLGGRCLQRVLADAATAGEAVVLRVDERNPALRLYRRLGFEPVGHEPPDRLLACHPARPSSTQPLEPCHEQA